MTRTTFRLVAVGIAGALTLSACGGGDGEGEGSDGAEGSGSSGEDVTLNMVWWGNDDRATRYNEAIALFEEENPNITVNATFADWEGYWTARSTEAAGRALPDVFQMDLSYLAEYSTNDHLLDLNPYIGEQIDLSAYDETLVEAGSINDVQVGIPTSTNTLAMFVNTALAEEAGVEPLSDDYTWEDYYAYVEEITAAGIENEGQPVYGGADPGATFWLFVQYLVQQGQQPFTEDGGFNFTEADIATYLEATADLRQNEAIFPPERITQLAPLDGFAAGEQATTMTWDNFLAGYDAEIESGIDILPMPSNSSGEKMMFWKPSMLLSSGANTEHPEEAAMLIDFLVNEPEVGTIFGTSKGVPAAEAQREAMELEEGSVDAQVTAFEEEVADMVTAETPAPIQGFGAIEAEWLRLSEDLAYGMITPQEFAEQWWAEAELATK